MERADDARPSSALREATARGAARTAVVIKKAISNLGCHF